MLIAYAVALGLLLFEGDAKEAFYGSVMDKEGVWVQLPIGFNPFSRELRDLAAPPLYVELAKGVPGIPQGSRLFYLRLDAEMKKNGYVASVPDPCLYISQNTKSVVHIHVDDLLGAFETQEEFQELLGPDKLGKEFKFRKEGPLVNVLGLQCTVEYTANYRRVFITQQALTETVLERASMSKCNGAKTPGIPGFVFTKKDQPKDSVEAEAIKKETGLDQKEYRSIVQGVNHITCSTRPDLKYWQSQLGRNLNNPGIRHIQALKHFLRYLRTTTGWGIEFVWRASDSPPLDGPLNLIGYSDSSFNDCVDTNRSTQAYVFTVNGSVVSWHSKLGSTVDSFINHSEFAAYSCASGIARHTSHGDICALKLGGRDAVWLRAVKAALERRSPESISPTPIYVDNAGVIAMLEDPVHHSANKHICHSLAEAREQVAVRQVVAIKCASRDNLANPLTKQLGVPESMRQLSLLAGPPGYILESGPDGFSLGEKHASVRGRC